MRNTIIEILTATQGQSEGVTADAILAAVGWNQRGVIVTPHRMAMSQCISSQYMNGWNDCRESIISTTNNPPESVACGHEKTDKASVSAPVPVAFHEIAIWLRSAIQCREFRWDHDQREAAQQSLDEAMAIMEISPVQKQGG